MTNKQIVVEKFPLSELRFKRGRYIIILDGYGNYEGAVIIGVGNSPIQAWKNARITYCITIN